MSIESLQVNGASTGYMTTAAAQDVPLGYKRTDVGVIPEDWEVRCLGASATFRTGPFGSALHKADYVAGGTPLINPMHIIDGRLLPEERISVSNFAADRLVAYTLIPGDIVIGRRGEMGRCAVVRPSHTGWLCGTGSLIIRCHNDVDAEYVQRILTTKRVIGAIESASVGSTMINLNQAALSGLQIPCPPSPEQRAIAEALSDVDGLLGALAALIAKKRAIKQAAMQQLLTGKTRLPGFSGEWNNTTLNEVAEIKNGATPSTRIAALWNGTIPWCTPTDITGTAGKYLSKTERYITEAGLTSCAASLLPPGALLLCSRATIGALKIATTKICTNQGFKSLVCRQSISNEFLYYLVLTLKPQIIERAIGSTFLEIGKRDLASIAVTMPREGEQTAIAAVLSDMDAEITALEHRRNKTKHIKQGMMQQLLTGRVRLVKPAVGS